MTPIKYEGIIKPGGSGFCEQIGFTPDKFDGYLWMEGDEVWITFVNSKDPGKGNLSKMFKKIEKLGYKVVVPNVFTHMRNILIHLGFKEHQEYFQYSKGAVREGDWVLHKMCMLSRVIPLPDGEKMDVWRKE